YFKDKVRREKVFEVDDVLDIDNSRASSFQVKGIHVDEIKVNAVRDWSSSKTLPEVRNNKLADALSRKTTLLVSSIIEVMGFDSIKDLYANDEYFRNIRMELETKQYQRNEMRHHGKLINNNKHIIDSPLSARNPEHKIHRNTTQGLSGIVNGI
nr:hypothetical protein [Tanacetum cinerariifolium]